MKKLAIIPALFALLAGTLALPAQADETTETVCDTYCVREKYGEDAKILGDEVIEVTDQGLTIRHSRSSNAEKEGQIVYRLYNRVSGEHLYTTDKNEVQTLAKFLKTEQACFEGEKLVECPNNKTDWNYEGVAWVGGETTTTDPVVRLYNPVLGDHHYTSDQNEINVLTSRYDWINEGTVFFEAALTEGTVSVYRQYNPGLRVGAHLFTVDKNEYDINNAKNGWQGEGTSFTVYPYTESCSVSSVPNTDSSEPPKSYYRIVECAEDERFTTSTIPFGFLP